MSNVEFWKLLIDLFIIQLIVTDQQLDIKLFSYAITNIVQKCAIKAKQKLPYLRPAAPAFFRINL